MSDRRVKYIILASIIFVGIVGMSQGQGLFELNDAYPFTPAKSLGYSGHVTIFLKDPDGNIQGYYQTDNDVMDVGANCSMDLLFDTAFNPSSCDIVRYMALGSSGTTVDAKQTDLFDKTENGNELATLTGIIDAAGGIDEAVDLILEHTFVILAGDNGEAILEAGIFDGASTTANMFARTLVGPFTMVSTGSQVEVIWTIHVN